MIKIKEKLLTKNRWSRPGRKRKGVKGIEIHYVANAGTSAKFNRRWFEGHKNGKTGFGSTQYIIDLNGNIVQIIPDEEIAYSSGGRKYKEGIKEKLGTPPYHNTLSIECTHTENDGKMTDETYNSLIELCTYLCNKYKLDSRNLYLHYDCTGKICHKWFVDNLDEWKIFKNSVEGGLKS